ncbi:glycosyltransferase family 2 protein [Alteromonas sp. ASW11-130]|uniref:glycosyltransferase family 2 protein n=1 Tax=Alteromonas sp. ASW11-130 TaxID=3015775 RepID=UPI0022424CB7|nr:glycosyltransferase family A protein [Alteromonas sp. ASW11-130]MCW8091284.1 glycosyltransferase family 2 protein [Alteromonas sp. ASW11-130]
MTPALSIVVPIYNVENYIEECINSLLNQTFSDIEIILVDDQSKDKSGEIARTYSKKDSRITYIKRERNGGLSAARNTGLEVATGHWVTFVDSDDYVSEDCYEVCLEKQKEKPESNLIIFSAYYLHDADGSLEISQYSDTDTNGADWFWRSNVIAWNKIYRLEELTANGLLFAEGLKHEDEEFWFKYTSIVELDPVVVHRRLYYYRQRHNSITSSNTSYLDLPAVLASMKSFLLEKGLLEEKLNYFIFKFNILFDVILYKLESENKYTCVNNSLKLLDNIPISETALFKLLSPRARLIWAAKRQNISLICDEVSRKPEAKDVWSEITRRLKNTLREKYYSYKARRIK